MLRRDRPLQVLAKKVGIQVFQGLWQDAYSEELHQPVVVLSIENGKAKGSARSVEAVDIFKALKDHQDLFIAFGGHAGAGGMTLAVVETEELAQTLADDIIENKLDVSAAVSLVLDEELDLEELTIEYSKIL